MIAAPNWNVDPTGPLTGELTPPGDKSISHRCLIIGTLASGPVKLTGLLDSLDVRATAHAVEMLGATLEIERDALILCPPAKLAEPTGVIDCGNSGTTMRLLMGLLAAEDTFAVMTGDASLRGRPMLRIAGPLRLMGAKVDGREKGNKAPISVRGPLRRAMAHDLPIASAQVKTALLLAGRKVGVSVRETRLSRDHTELLLRHAGAKLTRSKDGWMRMQPFDKLDPFEMWVPGDLSAAAFWLAAASIIPGSEIVLRNVGVNPTRTGIIDVLKQMGAKIEVQTVKAKGELVADLRVSSADLIGTTIEGELALRAIDELPVIAVVAAFAQGETVISGVSELRVKESDRIAAVVDGLTAMGIDVVEKPDGMVIQGGKPTGPATIDTLGDHRIAMAFAVAAMAGGPLTLKNASCATSYPNFEVDMDKLRGS